MQSLQLITDAMGWRSHILAPSDNVWVITLTPGMPRLITPPADSRVVLFNATASFWARIGGPAQYPVLGTNITDGTAPELAPTARALLPNSQIGLVSAVDTLVNLVFYR